MRPENVLTAQEKAEPAPSGRRAPGQYLLQLRRRVVGYQRTFILERDLSLPIEQWEPSIPVEFRLATPQDIESLTFKGHVHEGIRQGSASPWSEREDVCVVGIHNGRVVSEGWLCFRELEYSGGRVALGPGSVSSHHVRTAAAYRGRGIHQASLSTRLAVARELGAKRVFCGVYAGNIVSLHNKLKAKYRIIGSTRAARLFSRWYLVVMPRALGGVVGHRQAQRPRSQEPVEARMGLPALEGAPYDPSSVSSPLPELLTRLRRGD